MIKSIEMNNNNDDDDDDDEVVMHIYLRILDGPRELTEIRK